MVEKSRANLSVVAGIFWMFGCVLSFMSLALASRELTDTLSVPQILFLRNLCGLLIIGILCWGKLKKVAHSEQPKLQFKRNVLHFAGQYLWIIGVALLPLAQVFALEFTTPIWVAIFSFLILGERINSYRYISIIGGFLGVLIIVRPGVVEIDAATIMVLLSAASMGMSIVLVKKLITTDSPITILFWMVASQLIMALPLAFLNWKALTILDFPWIIIISIAALSAHYCMAKAIRVIEPTVIIPIDFARVPLIAVVAYYLYGEALDIWIFAGAVLIFVSNYISMRRELLVAKRVKI